MSNDNPELSVPKLTISKSEIVEAVNRVKGRISVTKVVSTRAVKTGKGDFFVGFSASWDSVQDDAGGLGDLDISVDSKDVSSSGMTLMDAQIAQQILNKEASVAAWRSALSEGAISEDSFDERVKQITSNTAVHIGRIIQKHKV
jgi:hypothetical protein